MTLERALYRLLHHASFRAAWRRGDDLGLSAEDVDALATLDPSELERAARLVIRGVIDRTYAGIGGIRDLYPRSLAAWVVARPDDVDLTSLVAGFLESPEGDGWNDVDGASLEDAFGRTLAGHVDVDVAEDERCTAVAKGILAGRSGDVRVPRDFSRCATGWYRVRATASGPVLYAAVSGRLVRGPITDTIAGWIVHGAPEGPGREAMARIGLL